MIDKENELRRVKLEKGIRVRMIISIIFNIAAIIISIIVLVR
jgi:hypothetical protein